MKTEAKLGQGKVKTVRLLDTTPKYQPTAWCWTLVLLISIVQEVGIISVYSC